jgi:hypothetical protein
MWCSRRARNATAGKRRSWSLDSSYLTYYPVLLVRTSSFLDPTPRAHPRPSRYTRSDVTAIVKPIKRIDTRDRRWSFVLRRGLVFIHLLRLGETLTRIDHRATLRCDWESTPPLYGRTLQNLFSVWNSLVLRPSDANCVLNLPNK